MSIRSSSFQAERDELNQKLNRHFSFVQKEGEVGEGSMGGTVQGTNIKQEKPAKKIVVRPPRAPALKTSSKNSSKN